jgi:hypothetical protein
MSPDEQPRVWKVAQDGNRNNEFRKKVYELKRIYVIDPISGMKDYEEKMESTTKMIQFRDQIKIDDFVIVPRQNLHGSFLAKVTSDYKEDPNGVSYNKNGDKAYRYREIELRSEFGNFTLNNIQDAKNWRWQTIERAGYFRESELMADFKSEDQVTKLVDVVTEFVQFSDWCYTHNQGEYRESKAKQNHYITGKSKRSNNSDIFIAGKQFGWSYNVNGAGRHLWRRGYVNFEGNNIVYDRNDETARKLKLDQYIGKGRGKGKTETIDEINLGSDSPTPEQIHEIVVKFWKLVSDGAPKTENTEMGKHMTYQNEYSTKVLESKNVIFRGAPGTGKSYLAKEIASDIVSNGVTQDYKKLSDKQRQQIEFVQFHPSYDYTDFVEGLRPKTNDDGTMGFELQDGVFKQFVTKALKAQNISVDNFDETWEKLMTKLDDEDYLEIPSLQGDKNFSIELNSTGAGLVTRSYPGKYGDGEWLQGHNRYYNKEQLYNIYRGLPGVPHRGLDNYRRAIVQYMENHLDLKKYRPSKNKNNQPYVFIIDEINRGEISKIFGELFFSIDPGYRGHAGEVATQYANLHENPDEKFFIPDNVYIIGTMNDIDRSVDSFDFAMRRRFRFIEIKADERLDMLDILGDKKDEAVWRMTALNQAISTVAELNENYFIGASYFLKTQRLTFDQLWSDYLAPLLQDYVRGMFDETGIMQKFYDAYNSPASEMGDSDGKTAD